MRRKWKAEPKVYITVPVQTKLKTGEVIGKTRPLKILLQSNSTGIIVKDGRQVAKEQEIWIYYAQ